MFLAVAGRACLRQGDILDGIPFPRLSTADTILIGQISGGAAQRELPTISPVTAPHRDDPNWLTAQLPVRLSFCAVISQCCDLEPKNERLQMPAFAVARLIPIPKSIVADPQKLSSLRGNKDPRNNVDPGYINFFHVPAHQLLGGMEWLVDYNQTLSIPGSEFPKILGKKILQMDDRWRVKFKIKLAASMARLTTEERGAGLENPWLEGA